MTTYPAGQVLTVSELHRRDILHCGLTGGQCMKWEVIDVDHKYAYIRVGGSKGSMTKMTGRDLRGEKPMYRAIDCPNCNAESPSPNTNHVTPKEPDRRLVVQRLEAADVSSVLSSVENLRKGQGKSGGAAITSQRRYFNQVSLRMAEEIIRKSKK